MTLRTVVKRAFTLVELLAIVGILVVLAAVLHRLVMTGNEKRATDGCIQNERKLSGALQMYATDADDTLPMAYYPAKVGPPFTRFSWRAGAGKASWNWADIVWPYAKNIAIYACPADKSGPFISAGVAAPGAVLSYGLNYYFYAQPTGVRRFTKNGGGLSEIPSPLSQILLGETASALGNELIRPDEFLAPDGTITYERHRGGANYVFADGHLEFHEMPNVWKDKVKWEMPDVAQEEPTPQWFPWLRSPKPVW